ncbi:MAG: D-alanine--D-alanine ligase family protein [Limisphaerales bacterium]
MNEKLNITVMLGGPSAEREVSLNTGGAVADALTSLGHQVTQLDPIPGEWRLEEATQVVFLALHGDYGEDGTVQVELDRLGVPYTGCGAASSRIAFDKVLSKERFVEHGVPTSPYEVLTALSSVELENEFRPPVVLKPVCQGSSVGLQFVDHVADFDRQLKEALLYGDRILMEPKINGREITVGILDGEALPIVEIRPKEGAYDYRNKYTVGATEYFCPADFSEEATRRIQEAGLAAFRSLECRDYARVDMMVPANENPLVLEVNTLPGMTATSLLPKAAAAVGISYEALCQRMVDLALKRAPVAA